MEETRRPNFSELEKASLIEAMNEHKKLLNEKHSNTVTKKKKKR